MGSIERGWDVEPGGCVRDVDRAAFRRAAGTRTARTRKGGECTGLSAVQVFRPDAGRTGDEKRREGAPERRRARDGPR